MRLSLNWLNDYIDIRDIKPQDLCHTLTMLGLEIEACEKIEAYTGSVVVGKIVEAEPHPDADKLQICQVDVGNSAQEPLTIVCGAPNARKGLTVATALVGAKLPGDFKIKVGKIRGQKSSGMLCSGKELGISQEDDGIIELDPQHKAGTELSALYPLSDTVLTISITPNRADCLSYIGIARDLSAKLKRPLKQPSTDIEAHLLPRESTPIFLSVENESDCPHLGAIGMKRVQAVDSPLWIQKRLEHSGIRPINILVDASNYVMLEQGHPIHAYDAQSVAGRTIAVRRAKDGETLATLDEHTRKLTCNDLIITDKEKPIGLAGVMGGGNSEVNSTTEEIIVEVAQFDPGLIRKTAKRFALHSEASHRFERGIDPSRIKHVANRYCNLLIQLTKELREANQDLTMPEISFDAELIGSSQARPNRIALRLDRLRKISGFPLITQAESAGHLESLGFKLLDQAHDRMLFEVPTWRLDVVREVDLIEEVVRLHGVDKITPTLPMMEIGTLPEAGHISFQDGLKRQLASLGFSETISFPFIGENEFQHLELRAPHPYREAVSLKNPLVEDQGFLRTSLIFSLLKALETNHRHGISASRLFECGRVFFKPIQDRTSGPQLFECSLLNTKEQGAHITGQALEEKIRPIERNMIAGIIDSVFLPATWDKPEEQADFFHAKSVICSLLAELGINSALTYERPKDGALPFLHPGKSAVISFGNQIVGYLGSVHPKTALAYDFDFRHSPVIFEMDADLLWRLQKLPKTYDSVVSRFPAVIRDIAIVVPDNISHKDVLTATESFDRQKNLKNITLFDVYQGENLGESKKSLAYHLTFQNPKKTLTDAEVDKELQALLSWYREQLSAELR